MRRLVGHVGIDSGQLLLTDPCYVLKNGPQETTFENRGLTYEVVCNATTDMKGWMGVKPFVAPPNEGCAELAKGIAVVTSQFGGDGSYPVFAEYSPNGLVRSITVEFDYDEDAEDEDD